MRTCVTCASACVSIQNKISLPRPFLRSGKRSTEGLQALKPVQWLEMLGPRLVVMILGSPFYLWVAVRTSLSLTKPLSWHISSGANEKRRRKVQGYGRQHKNSSKLIQDMSQVQYLKTEKQMITILSVLWEYILQTCNKVWLHPRASLQDIQVSDPMNKRKKNTTSNRQYITQTWGWVEDQAVDIAIESVTETAVTVNLHSGCTIIDNIPRYVHTKITAPRTLSSGI